MTSVAIVTATAFGGEHNKECFNSGLRSALLNTPEPVFVDPLQSQGNYSITRLRGLVREAVNTNPRPDLIVTTEGLVMAQAAALELTEQDPKFISLSGFSLGWNPVTFAGGVNMNMSNQGQNCLALLKQRFPNVVDDSVYLVVNNNCPMLPYYVRHWPSSRIVRFLHDMPNPELPKRTADADNYLIAEFKKLAEQDPAPSGLVVSPDPYFRLCRTAFTLALAAVLPVPVCYAFEDFVTMSQATSNKENSIALNKPPLNNTQNPGDENTAIFQLGRQVGRFISGATDVGVVRWNGSAWDLHSKDSDWEEASGQELEVEVFRIRSKGRPDKKLLQELLAAIRGQQ